VGDRLWHPSGRRQEAWREQTGKERRARWRARRSVRCRVRAGSSTDNQEPAPCTARLECERSPRTSPTTARVICTCSGHGWPALPSPQQGGDCRLNFWDARQMMDAEAPQIAKRGVRVCRGPPQPTSSARRGGTHQCAVGAKRAGSREWERRCAGGGRRSQKFLITTISPGAQATKLFRVWWLWFRYLGVAFQGLISDISL
jgi:hypothetical protein